MLKEFLRLEGMLSIMLELLATFSLIMLINVMLIKRRCTLLFPDENFPREGGRDSKRFFHGGSVFILFLFINYF